MTQHVNAGALTQVRSLIRQLDQALAQAETMADGEAGSMTAWEADQRLEQVITFASRMIAARDLEATMDEALVLAMPIVGATRGLIWIRDTAETSLERIKSAVSDDGNFWAAQKIARTLVDKVVESGAAVFVPDVSQDAFYAEEASAYGLDLMAMFALPLYEGDRLLGVLYLDRGAAGGPFQPMDLKLVEALAPIAARALSSGRQVQEQDDRREHLEMINRLYQAISKTLELEQVLDHLAMITLDVTKAERAFILMLTNGQLYFGAGRDKEGPIPAAAGREISRSVCEKVLKTRQGVYVFDMSQDAEFAAKNSVVALQLNSVVAVPLMGQQGLSGVLYVDSRTKSLTGLQKELAVLTAISNVASLSIENAKLFRQATIDGLTGLFVRSFFMMRLEEEIRRSTRYARPFSLLVMDIDHFKRFNDTYGHQTGDEVIKLVAQAIKHTIRTGVDLPGRYGGEELVVLLPETDVAGAFAAAERIRMAIQGAALPGPNGEALRVTISIGVATYPQMADTAVLLFDRADQALYQSKEAGRNRTTVYQDTVTPR